MDDNPYQSPSHAASNTGAATARPGRTLLTLAPIMWFLLLAVAGVGATGVTFSLPIKVAFTAGGVAALYALSLAGERRLLAIPIWVMLVSECLIMWGVN